MDDLIDEFLEETNENLNILGGTLLDLEKQPNNPEILNEVFRNFHTIKGSGGALGFSRLQRLAHAAESVLSKVREGKLTVDTSLVSLILKVIDSVKQILEYIAANRAEPEQEFVDLLAKLGQYAELPDQIAVQQTAQTLEPSTPKESGGTDRSAASSNGTNSIRVKLSTLEDMMNITSELVLIRNQLLQILKSQENSAFACPLGRLNKITTNIQETIMKVRMQPVKTAWTKLARIVRDLANKLGKQIDLKMIGEDTELDRQVLELIADPFVHIIRNSIDHGIESPDVRKSVGKDAVGTITLNAYHESGHVIVEISDDGAGINTAKLKEKLLTKGTLTQKDLEKLTDDQINQYIFKSGVSTAAEVSDVSGRGVGMDVVMTNINKVNGAIDLISSPGKGSIIKIKIPLTLAIAPVLIVECNNDIFAVPQTNVLEILFGNAGKKHKISHIDGAKVLVLRGEMLPLVSIQDVLNLSPSKKEGYILILQITHSVFGLMVDNLLDTEEIVLRPPGSVLKGIKVFSGSAILGDGRVVMVIDPNSIAKRASIGDTKDVQSVEIFNDKKLVPILLFKNFNGETNAVDLKNISRMEKVRKSAIENSVNGYVVQHNNVIIPVVFDGETNNSFLFLIILQKDNIGVAFATPEVIDIIDADLEIQQISRKNGYLGSAVIDGITTDVLDSDYYLNIKDFKAIPSGNNVATRNTKTKLKKILLISSNNKEISDLQEVLRENFDMTCATDIHEYSGELPEVIIIGEYINQSNCLEVAQKIKTGIPKLNPVPLVKLFLNASKQDVALGIKAGILRYIPTKNKQTILQSLINLIASRQSPGGD
ncbi:MAG: chemotaxis protein CheA [Holosporales bacterium]|jgi:two-component system chemotaxis sensor kinase CheA|nr:chemotaxis protein CheA [Holosporales bacterium]